MAEFAPNAKLVLLTWNVDDMTGEDFGFAYDALMSAGAREVYAIPIQMKKGRPGLEIHALCAPEDEEKLVKAAFAHTTTFGIRRSETEAYALARSTAKLNTDHGSVRVKIGEGFGITKSKLEYEDAARYAREAGISMEEVRKRLNFPEK